MNKNILLLTDSYKLTHWRQYPQGTEEVYSYFESRGGAYDEVVFFGLQYFIHEYLKGQVITKEKIDEAETFAKLHLGDAKLFNREGWEYILNTYGGRLPVSIKAVPEGSVIPISNVLMTINNTDPKCFWLTNYLETLLVQVWYPTTVATLSRQMKKMILKHLKKTGNPELIDFKLHDFGFRGVSSVESAAVGGAAHLVNFKGTDTIAGAILARDYYNELIAGFSIPASEHSTITSWGKDQEVDAMRNMLEAFKESPLVACVSDSYDIFNACANLWGDKLKENVLNFKGTLVVRPDSGYPPKVVLDVLNILGDKFGYEINLKGYKVLNPKIRVIQGDGVDFDMADRILSTIAFDGGWSTDNLAFGMGGALLQKLNRDTQKFAFKCSSATVNGLERHVYKEPVTDIGKVSKAGKLKLVEVEGMYGKSLRTVRADITGEKDLLEEVFRNGELLVNQNFSDIRLRAKL
jgi:nicotinamide phosphoribosyltransferase